ncbi:MAG: hypothetical protein ACI8WB_004709 [Phenylobacterium sp.]|jgi:hypothetical protein
MPVEAEKITAFLCTKHKEDRYMIAALKRQGLNPTAIAIAL